jgi:hypothetical protein
LRGNKVFTNPGQRSNAQETGLAASDVRCRARTASTIRGGRTGCEGPSLHTSSLSSLILSRATNQAQALTTLLIEVSSQLDAEGKKKVEDLLASFEDDTPLPTSQGKRPRQESPSHHDDDDDGKSPTSADGGEAHVTASVGSIEDLDFIQEDLLQSEEASSTGFMGRNSQVQWLRALEVRVKDPEDEPSNMPTGPPGPSADAFNQRAKALHERQENTEQKSAEQGYFTDFNFYLDKTDIDIDVGDPQIIPSADTAETLFNYYKAAVHSPFWILDDDFEAQLQSFYTKPQIEVTLPVCSKWKAIMNLVFAIGARYSHLIAAEWQADDRDHLVYMWRAVHLLELSTMDALFSQPDQSLIQVSFHLTRRTQPVLKVIRAVRVSLWAGKPNIPRSQF